MTVAKPLYDIDVMANNFCFTPSLQLCLLLFMTLANLSERLNVFFIHLVSLLLIHIWVYGVHLHVFLVSERDIHSGFICLEFV